MRGYAFAHFEKGVLALFLVFVAVAAKPLLAKPAEVAMQEEVLALDERLGQQMMTGTVKREPVPDEAARLRAAVSPGEPVEPLPGWLAHRRPGVIFYVPTPPPLEHGKHVAPVLEAASAHGKVTLTFGPSKTETNVCSITGWRLLRTDAAGKTIELAQKSEPGTFVDDQVEPRATYTYTVVESADAPPNYAPLDAAEVALTATKTATLPREWVIHPSRFAEVDPVLSAPTVIKLYVWRWKDGKWSRKEAHGVKPKDPIGKKEGKEDYATGAVLQDIAHEKGVTTITVNWPSGLVETLKSTDTYDEIKKPGD